MAMFGAQSRQWRALLLAYILMCPGGPVTGYDQLHMIDLQKVMCPVGQGGTGYFDAVLDTTQLSTGAAYYSPHVVTFLRSTNQPVYIQFTLLDSLGNQWSENVREVTLNQITGRRLAEVGPEGANSSSSNTEHELVEVELDEEPGLEDGDHARRLSGRRRSSSGGSSPSPSPAPSPPRRRSPTPSPPPRRRRAPTPTPTPSPSPSPYPSPSPSPSPSPYLSTSPRRRGSVSPSPSPSGVDTSPRRRGYYSPTPSPSPLSPRRRGNSYTDTTSPRRRTYAYVPTGSQTNGRWSSTQTGGTAYGYTSQSAMQSNYVYTGSQYPSAYPYGYSGYSNYGYAGTGGVNNGQMSMGTAFLGGAAVGVGSYYIYNRLSRSTCYNYQCCYGCANSCYNSYCQSGNCNCKMSFQRTYYRDDVLDGAGFYPSDFTPNFPLKVRVLNVSGVGYDTSVICPPAGCDSENCSVPSATVNDLFVTVTQMSELSDPVASRAASKGQCSLAIASAVATAAFAPGAVGGP